MILWLWRVVSKFIFNMIINSKEYFGKTGQKIIDINSAANFG